MASADVVRCGAEVSGIGRSVCDLQVVLADEER